MAGPTTHDLAAHIAAILDGDWDDGIGAYVEASAIGNGLHIHLTEDEEDGRIATYRVIVEQIS